MIPVDVRGHVDRHVVGRRRRRPQPRLLLGGEHLCWALLGRSVHPPPGPFATPPLGPALAVGGIDERRAPASPGGPTAARYPTGRPRNPEVLRPATTDPAPAAARAVLAAALALAVRDVVTPASVGQQIRTSPSTVRGGSDAGRRHGALAGSAASGLLSMRRRGLTIDIASPRPDPTAARMARLRPSVDERGHGSPLSSVMRTSRDPGADGGGEFGWGPSGASQRPGPVDGSSPRLARVRMCSGLFAACGKLL
jgi:hypothetical protein